LLFNFFRVVVDPARRYGFILCPNAEIALALRARYVRVGAEQIFFDLVRSVQYFPFIEDVN
jgi:hypothetical protein